MSVCTAGPGTCPHAPISRIAVARVGIVRNMDNRPPADGTLASAHRALVGGEGLPVAQRLLLLVAGVLCDLADGDPGRGPVATTQVIQASGLDSRDQAMLYRLVDAGLLAVDPGSGAVTVTGGVSAPDAGRTAPA